MCQLNIYMLKNNVNDEDVSKCFEYGKYCQNISIQIDKLSEGYKSYCNNFFMCDCNSILCKLKDKKGLYDSYEDYFEKTKAEQLNQLYEIRDFLLLPNSKETLEKFKNECELVFQKTLNEPLKNNGNQTFEVGPKMNEYQEFLAKNKFLWNANLYCLEKNSDSIYPICIDDAIDKAKNASMQDITKEFDSLVKQIENMLKLSDDVKIFAYWQDGEPLHHIKEEKTVSFHELKIEDVVFLDYKQILTITK